MRDIDELLKQQPPKRELTPEEYSEAYHKAALEQIRDFTPNRERLRWPKPVGPRWKN